MTKTRIHLRGEPAPSLVALALLPGAFGLAGLAYLIVDYTLITLLLARVGCGCG